MKNFFKKLFCSDSWSKNFSETVRRVGKNNAGFSLVELIVVIAIMAILAAVAVVGVSVYIPKAQKAADEQMIADVKKAIELYAGAETLTPGQSGYVVIHKNKGTGEVGNVTVGGAMDQMITEALAAMYGETKYGTELKVSYQKWTGVMNIDEIQSVQNSVYIDNTDDIMGTVQTLTDALKAFHGGSSNPDAQKEANGAVLEVAANAGKYVNTDAFVAWWTDPNNLAAWPDNGEGEEFTFPAGVPESEITKSRLAALYAKFKAIVLSTGCQACNDAFNDPTAFENVNSSSDAVAAMNAIIQTTTAHVQSGDNGGPCSQCNNAINNYCSATGSAKDDAKAYLAVLGQIDGMSDEIVNSPEFSGDGLYTSDFITGTVDKYVSSVGSYSLAYSGTYAAQEGDIVIAVMVDRNGNLQYQVNITD